MMKTKIINSFQRMNKLTVFYLLFFLVIVITLSYAGCGDVQKNLVTAPEIGIHPAGWADTTSAATMTSPNFHGQYIYDNNAWTLTQCKTCHGGDYTGGTTGSSCLTCHKAFGGPLNKDTLGGPENCGLCHGLLLSLDELPVHSNPPKALNGSTSISDIGVGMHYYHLDTTNYSAKVKCNECHLPVVTTGGFNSPNHLGENPDGTAEINFGTLARTSIGGGITPDPVWDSKTGTCSNVYCHGDFIYGNRNAAPVWTDPNSVKCGSCHGDPETGNPTPRDSNGVFVKPHYSFFTSQTCYVCHRSVINPQGVIDHKELHVNGEVNY